MSWKKWFVAILLSLAVFGSTGCSWYISGRCWVDENRYTEAKRLYNRTGSIALTHSMLEDEGWRRCEINEVVYRLKKEYNLE
ncbi:MAG: hypothetical protein V2A74_09870 [bacterium]